MKTLEHHWKEGKYFDLWSITHTLSGVVLASILFYFEMNVLIATVIALMLFVGWEAVEVALGIKEHLTNMIMDVLFDLAGFFIVLYYCLGLGKEIGLPGVVYSSIAFLIFNLWGYLAHKKRVMNGESHLQ